MRRESPGLWGLFVCSTLSPAVRNLFPVVLFSRNEIMLVEVLTWLASYPHACLFVQILVFMTRVKYHLLTITLRLFYTNWCLGYSLISVFSALYCGCFFSIFFVFSFIIDLARQCCIWILHTTFSIYPRFSAIQLKKKT